MGLSQAAQFALSVSFFGVLAFILAAVAENKKPPFGEAIQGKGVVICKFPSDPTVALGVLSILSLLISTVLGWTSVFFPYKGKSVPRDALFQSMVLFVFFFSAVIVFVLGEGIMMWATITEALHHSRNVHHDLNYACPTAKTGLLGAAAFLGLDASLLWLVCQMLTHNARADYFDEDDQKGSYGQVLDADYDNAAPKV